MTEFANAAGLSVVAVIKEVASGVDDTRPKLTALLKEDSWGTLVVEHKDRLSRVGLGWLEVLLGLQRRRIVVADAATEEKADLLDDFVSMIYSLAARLYGLRSARRRTDEVIVALGLGPAVGARLVTGVRQR
jgi:putative resolvase